MPGVDITLTGFEEARQELLRKKENVIKGMTKGMQQIGFYVEGKVKESIAGQNVEPTSVDTGRFLNSVTSQVSSDIATHEQQVVIYTPLDYPVFLEYGTSTIEPRRHFSNTLEREKPAIHEMMSSVVKESVED